MTYRETILNRLNKNVALTKPSIIFVLLFVIFPMEVKSLHVFMVQSSSSQGREALRKSIAKSAMFPTNFDLTSGLVSQLAVIAIQSRLKEQSEVCCDVSSRPDRLVQGIVGPVTVRGIQWQSGLGLTCRKIEATVQQCELDLGRILSHRKLMLTRPAIGRAMVALNSVDFGNFITHPLLNPPDSNIEFIKQGVMIDPATNTVQFFARYLDTAWRCDLKRSSTERKALVDVHPADNVGDVDQTEELSRTLERFFNEMVFELDGTFLNFRDMRITDKGEAASVMIALDITVIKFPSPGVEF
jgi:hypothetical protein